jgi:outer membrane lipoprotein SlyB
MRINRNILSAVALLGCGFLTADALAQSTTVNHGRITAVRQVNLQNQSAQTAGTLLGGLAGVASGSGNSQSNRALRGVGGAAVGRGVAGAMSSSTGFEYTVLINGRNTITIVTEKAGLRVGDCVSVERGSFNNIRLASDDRCDAAANAAVPRAAASAADACTTATQQVLNAQTDAEFERAERRMRLLCD